MKHSILKFLAISLSLLFTVQLKAQSITMTNGGNNQTCSGTFYDPGGTGNYSYSSTTFTHTICSDTPGEFPQVTFTAFQLWTNSCVIRSYDILQVYDGPSTSSPLIATYEQTQGMGATLTGYSGCLTFRFTRDTGSFLCASNSGAPGWAATITCIDEAPQTGDNCFEALPFCSDQSYLFPNSTTGAAPVGPNYGCLSTQPRPIWYYMKIADSGPMQLHLGQNNTSGGGIDIDFAMWGPFTDVPSGCSQIMGGGLAPLQCSYSTSATETIGLGMPGGTGGGSSTPPNAQAGEYYILLLTNYNGAAGNITLEQTGGTGATDCSIVEPCAIENFTANVSACANDLYSVDGTIEVSDAPDTGDLIVEDCNGNQTIVASAPFNTNTYTYNLNNLNADGSACDVEVYFSDATDCSQTINYTAPQCPPTPCNFDLLDISIHPCNNDNTFDITGTVEFSNQPTTGQLIIEDCNGNSETFNAPFTSPQNFSLTNIPADGSNCNITATFSADPSCTIDIDYVNVEDCSCAAQIGTFSVTTDGTQSNRDITLCYGQSFTFNANGDYTPPADVSNPNAVYDPGIWWGVYTCPPTVGTTPATGIDINDDPCLVTFLNATNITDLNDLSFINAFPPGTFTDNIVYFVPITMYSMVDGYYTATTTGAPCYQMGLPYAVQYLPEIITTEVEDCQAGTVTVTISGGSPAINGTNFTATNLIPASASFDNSTAANNGTIVVSGLQDGDNYSFDIEEGFNCSVNISGTFQGVSSSDFLYDQSQYCQNETNPTPTINGASGGTFTASPSGLNINASTGVINLNSSTIGTYTITYTSPGAPCNSTTDINVTVNPVPAFTLTPNHPTCGNSDGSITIGGLNPSSSYELSYTENSSSVGPQSETTNAAGEIVIGNLPQGSYTGFTIENTEGCVTINPNSINLNDIGGPSVTAPNDVEICLGESVTLTATNPDGATITWSNGISDGIPFTPTSAGTTTYIVTATDVNNCTATDNVEVIVNTLPTINAGQDQDVCEGGSVTLTATGAGNGGSYSWNPSVTNGIAFVPSTTQTYVVTGQDANGCENTDQVEIRVHNNPTPDFEGENLKGCQPLTVNFTNLTGISGATCHWDFGDGNSSTSCNNVSHTYTSSGFYSVTLTVTNTYGCTGTYTIQNYIEVTPQPVAKFTADPMKTNTMNPVINFTNESEHGTDYTWIFGDDSPNKHTFDATHTYPDNEEGTYIVTLIVSSGPNCMDTARAVITIDEELIFYVPNSFTPDNDDYNEVFKPIFASGYDPQAYTLEIFNRWGEIIFESHDVDVGWKGTYGEGSTKIVKEGTYVWKIRIKETGKDKHNDYVGHVTLLK